MTNVLPFLRLAFAALLGLTTLARALARGLHLYPQSVVHSIEPTPTHLVVNVLEGPSKRQRTFTTGRLVLAAGSLGNVKILKKSGLDKGLPHLGEDFFTHPQYMVLARYAKKGERFSGCLSVDEVRGRQFPP